VILLLHNHKDRTPGMLYSSWRPTISSYHTFWILLGNFCRTPGADLPPKPFRRTRYNAMICTVMNSMTRFSKSTWLLYLWYISHIPRLQMAQWAIMGSIISCGFLIVLCDSYIDLLGLTVYLCLDENNDFDRETLSAREWSLYQSNCGSSLSLDRMVAEMRLEKTVHR
jgi:hypothetical protein